VRFSILLLIGCASPNAPVSNDLASPAALPDLSTKADAAALPDLLSPDGAIGPCMLGDADHCGTCSTICPPGMDTAGTKRTCSGATAFATCGYVCRGEFYEMDGMASTGCEAEDAPVQDSATTAVTVNLPDGPLAAAPGPGLNPTNLAQQIYGDTLEHESTPASRPNGRDDWYKLVVSGSGATDRGVGACLGINSFPADNTFEVCLSGKGAMTFLPAGCKTVVGGATSQCIQQNNSTDGNGTYYVRVRRVSGATYTTNQYALYLDH
jgi:hypothetical protein